VKALLLAAGLGTRLGEITHNLPKALIEVGHKTILDMNIQKLQEIGVKEILVNTHHKSELIEAHLTLTDSKTKVNTSYEAKLLGTGSTLRKHVKWLSTSDFVVMHADNYFSDDLLGLKRTHFDLKSSETVATLATFDCLNPSECGIIKLSPDGTISEFDEKPTQPKGNLASSAIFIFRPNAEEVILELPNIGADISKDLVPKIMRKTYTHHLKGVFIDIGTPEMLNRARELETS